MAEDRGDRTKKRLSAAVDWLLDVGTFHCERQDCPGGPKPCGLCGMPEKDRRTEVLMNLYQRCKERGCLPYAGGVLDQPEDLMRDFDTIDERIALFKKRKQDDAEREDALERARRDLRGHGR